MSATKMTGVSVNRRRIMALRGHVTWAEAIDQTRAYYEQRAKEAAEYLAAIEAGEVRVYHQKGIYRVTSQVPVPPTEHSWHG